MGAAPTIPYTPTPVQVGRFQELGNNVDPNAKPEIDAMRSRASELLKEYGLKPGQRLHHTGTTRDKDGEGNATEFHYTHYFNPKKQKITLTETLTKNPKGQLIDYSINVQNKGDGGGFYNIGSTNYKSKSLTDKTFFEVDCSQQNPRCFSNPKTRTVQ